MLQIAICDDEVTNILKVKELAELFFRTHCVEIRWVKSCFATCDKDELFLGKNVLNARITQEQFVEEMKKIK